jgi:hypothetical protein
MVQIYNLALARVGHSELVANESEGSIAQITCSLFYEQSRDFVLEDFPWRFAKKRVALAVVSGTPPAAWAYQYAVPADCVRIRAIAHPNTRTPRADSKIPFERATDGDQQLIFTDLVDAELIYTCKITDPSKFDASFTSALAYHLASELAIPLRGASGGELAQMMQSAYSQIVRLAAAKSLNEGFDTTPQSEFLAARGEFIDDNSNNVFGRTSW